MKKLTIIATALLNISLIRAASIQDYRNLYPAPISVNSNIEALRELLGTKSNNVSSIEQMLALNEQGSQLRRSHVSSFVRKSLLESARDFMIKDQFDTPQLFEPSSTLTMEQVEANIRAKSQDFCRKNIQPQLDKLINEYFMQTDAQGASVQLASTPNKNKIINSFINYMNERSRVGNASQTFAQVLGGLRDVEIENATLSRLIFQSPDNSTVKLSLPMLISARTGEDYYFVQMLTCFHDLVSEKHVQLEKDIKDGKSKNTVERDSLKKLVSDFSTRVSGADAVYKRLASLSTEQLNALIDLFLVYNKNSYATAEEWDVLKMQIIVKTQPLSQKLKDAELNHKKNPADAKLFENYKKMQAEYAAVQYMLSDYNFFSETLDALYRLENTLRQEKDRAALKKEKP